MPSIQLDHPLALFSVASWGGPEEVDLERILPFWAVGGTISLFSLDWPFACYATGWLICCWTDLPSQSQAIVVFHSVVHKLLGRILPTWEEISFPVRDFWQCIMSAFFKLCSAEPWGFMAPSMTPQAPHHLHCPFACCWLLASRISQQLLQSMAWHCIVLVLKLQETQLTYVSSCS